LFLSNVNPAITQTEIYKRQKVTACNRAKITSRNKYMIITEQQEYKRDPTSFVRLARELE
jgi:hypothetical protein